MSLDILKERFGGSVSTNKKEVDKEKLNEIFNSNGVENLKSFKNQHQGELEEKNRQDASRCLEGFTEIGESLGISDDIRRRRAKEEEAI